MQLLTFNPFRITKISFFFSLELQCSYQSFLCYSLSFSKNGTLQVCCKVRINERCGLQEILRSSFFVFWRIPRIAVYIDNKTLRFLLLRKNLLITGNAWKVSVFRVILVRIFPLSEWISRDTPYLRIQSECVKKRATITSNTDTFYAVGYLT